MSHSWMQQTQQSWESETWGVDLEECPLSEQDALGNSELLARWFLRHVDVLYAFYVAPLYPEQG